MTPALITAKTGFSKRLQVLAQVLAEAARTLGAAFAPPRCAGCDWFADALFCEVCAARLQAWPTKSCACCGEPFDPLAQVLAGAFCAACRDNRYHGAPTLKRVRSLWMFSGPTRRAVHRFKYRAQWSLAAPIAAQMADFVRRDDDFPNHALIVPVPLFAWRQWRRGFNQSELLARELARELGWPHANALHRVRHTPSQTRLKGDERQENVRDAFQLAPTLDLAPARGAILLIDDVYTTGATLRECARQLQVAAPHISIYALTWARQPKPQLKLALAAAVPPPT